MICQVKLINQRKGKRTFMVTLERDGLLDQLFEPAKIADAIDGWGTIYHTQAERVVIRQGREYARLYVTTTDLSMNAKFLHDSIQAEHKILAAKEQYKAEQHE